MARPHEIGYDEDEDDFAPSEGVPFWRGVRRVLAWACAVAAIALSLAFFRPQWKRQQQVNHEYQTLLKERDQVRVERDALKDRIEWLKHDKDYLEMEVRDRLGYKRPGETVLRFQ